MAEVPRLIPGPCSICFQLLILLLPAPTILLLPQLTILTFNNMADKVFDRKFRGRYFSGIPELFPTSDKTLRQHKTNFNRFFFTNLFIKSKILVELGFKKVYATDNGKLLLM